MDDDAVVVQMVADRVEGQLSRQFNDNDALDAKCFGILGADAATIAVLVAVHDSINRYWPFPALALAFSAALLLYVVYPRKLDTGPNWRRYHEMFGGESPLDAGLQMLSELLAAVEGNKALAPHKSQVFKLGFIVMGVGLFGTLLVVLVR